MENDTEGNRTISRVVKERGRVVGHSSEHGGSGKMATHVVGEGLVKTGFKGGRTIELRRFESCRIKLGAWAWVPEGLDKKDVKVAAKSFILEMLKREEASVGDGNYEVDIPSEAISILNKCRGRYISVIYGLTLKSGKEFETQQVDVFEDLPVSDGADLIVAFDNLSDEMAAELDEENKRIKGTD